MPVSYEMTGITVISCRTVNSPAEFQIQKRYFLIAFIIKSKWYVNRNRKTSSFSWNQWFLISHVVASKTQQRDKRLKLQSFGHHHTSFAKDGGGVANHSMSISISFA